MVPAFLYLFSINNCISSCKCFINVFAEVFFADFFVNSGFMEELQRLFIDMTQNESNAFFAAGLDKCIKTVDSGCVNRRWFWLQFG